MTHTKGPWGHDKAGNDADQWLIYDENGRTIGLSYHGEDNARAFASAPNLKAINVELLEALEALADEVQGVHPNRNRLTRIAACKAARAAIASAKGAS